MIVIGRRPGFDGKPESPNVSYTEGVAATIDPKRFVRADHPKQLIDLVQAEFRKSGPIHRLDLVDDGHDGSILLGSPESATDKKLFVVENGALSKPSIERARALREFLTEDASVFLLGCETGKGVNGQTLLLSLQEVLGGRRVIRGALVHLLVRNFDVNGFKPELECPTLYSSTEAKVGPAPGSDARVLFCAAQVEQRGGRFALPEDLGALKQQVEAGAPCPSCARSLR